MGIFDKMLGGKPKEEKPQNGLEAQQWYHGVRTRQDIEEELVEFGDFVIRAQNNRMTTLVLNVKTKRGTSNYTIWYARECNKYVLHILINDLLAKKESISRHPKIPQFDDIFDLVNYYSVHPLPCGAKLKRGVPRPRWIIKHSSIEYNAETDKIASGNFGSVFRGYFKKDNGESTRAAIKVCHQEANQDDPQKALDARQAMIREAKIMASYDFANVITFFGAACDHPPIILVMEYCPGDSLENHLLANRGDTAIERVLYSYEAARGMRYLHIQGCIHSDLASRNCLISADGIIKIADFGLSKFVDDLNPTTAKLKIPIRWMAPECFGKKAQIIQKSDVWAYGVLLYEIFTGGEMPWPGDKDFKAMAKKIRAGDMPSMPESTPASITALVKKCWIVAHQDRTSMHECYEFLSDYLASHSSEFPPLEKLALNKCPGVKRTFTFREDPPDAREIQRTARRLTTTAKEELSGTGRQHSRSRSKVTKRRGVSKLTNLE